MLDQTKDGRFYFDEIMDFVATYSDRLAADTSSVNPVKDFQGFCTLYMWSWVSRQDGEKRFVDWFTKLFSQGMVTQLGPNREPFMSQDAIKILHRLLQIDKTYGLEFMPFFDLLQRVGEEMKLMTLDDEQFDYVVPVAVAKIFATEFINGFVNYMLQLEFKREMELI
jgi:hypothetical protein